MKREGLLPSKNTYFYGFECLGKLMNKNGSQLPPSSHPQSISKNKAFNRITPKSVIPMEKIGHEAKNLIDAAEKEVIYFAPFCNKCNFSVIILKSTIFNSQIIGILRGSGYLCGCATGLICALQVPLLKLG